MYLAGSYALFGLLSLVTANSLSIKLEAPWEETPFELSLIESVASYNESLYVPTILKIFGLLSEFDDDYDEDDDSDSDSQESRYHRVVDSLDPITKGLVGFDLVNKIHAPRIQAHYKYYTKQVLAQFSNQLFEQCSTDSFGTPLLSSPDDHLSSWVFSSTQFYCSSADLFALKTERTEEFTPQAFDRIIGNNPQALVFVLYSDPSSDEFVPMFSNLFQSAQSGKIRFVWRYVPSQSSTVEVLSGFGVDLSLKSTDYSVIDEENDATSKFKSDAGSTTDLSMDLNNDLWKILNYTPSNVGQQDMKDLGLKLASFVLSNPYKNVTHYELLSLMTANLPKFLPYIAQLKPNNKKLEQVKEQTEANSENGLAKESYGLYVNGSPVNKLELDLLALIAKIKDELQIMQQLENLDLSTAQAHLILSKFALLSAVKQSQFRSGNTVMGHNENRFKVYEHRFTKGSYKSKKGVVYINDIEKDPNYQQYSDSREETYLQLKLKSNQIPPLRENVHDLIFAINFAHREQLKVFFTLSKIILDTGIPQQIGLIALAGDDPMNSILAEKFYFIADTSTATEALAFLYKFYDAKDEDEVDLLLKSVAIPESYEFNHNTYLDTLKTFSIEQPTVICNGVIHEMASPTWQISMGKQLSQDISLIRHALRTGQAHGSTLREIIYNNAKNERNLRIIPLDPSDAMYKGIDSDLVKASVAFKPIDKPNENEASGTFWVVGNFNKDTVRKQLSQVFKTVKRSKRNCQVRVLNTGENSSTFEKLYKSINIEKMTKEDFWRAAEIMEEESDREYTERNFGALKLLEKKQLPPHHDFILFNSRYLRISDIYDTKDLNLLMEFEFSQRLEVVKDLVEHYQFIFSRPLNNLGENTGLNPFDYFDILSSILTKSFYPDDMSYVTDVNRYDFSVLETDLIVDVTNGGDDKPIEILLIVDPVDEYAQKMIALVNGVKDLNFVSVQILLQPKLDETEQPRRFYSGNFPEAVPQFKDGDLQTKAVVSLKNIPSSEVYSVGLDVPSSWITVIKDSEVDLDNIRFADLDVESTYALKSILIEGYARDVKTAHAPETSLPLQITQFDETHDTSVMATRGYFQLQAGPGEWNLSVKDGQYSILSATQKFSLNQKPLESASVVVFDLAGRNLRVRLKEEQNSVLPTEEDVINVFSIARGHLYERLIKIMMLSVKKHASKKVKFWILENFVSGRFKKTLPVLAESYGFDYEFVTYKWPKFLRQQRERQRETWGYKILFLDVLFPQDVHKVIFVDADQIVRSDLHELNTIDLQGAPYGFTPMCDSREEMEGFRFWKQGYWAQVLGDQYKYHISALFVVDLDRFRQMKAGDKLRAHYQKLSSDPSSLSNLDQDLPNNMQARLPIYSLPQEWLWCETWCATNELSSAKSIDLCNNPLTKENKLDQARRLIPEWSAYDEQVSEIQKSIDEVRKAEEDSFATDEGDSSLYEHDEL